MSRFHSSSSTGSAPGAASSNSTINMSALRGRGYQVPQNSSTLPPSHFRPLHVPYRWSQLILEEELLISRANIVTPVRPFKESSKLMATSESDSEIVAQSPLSDPFICSPIPFVYSLSPSPSPCPSPIPSPQPISQKPRSKRGGRFHDARPYPVIPNVTPYTIPNSKPAVTHASSSTEDDSDTTNYPSSLDSYSEATPESEAIPSTTIATKQSWIHRNSKTIKTVATWTLIAAAIILPKILWKWVARKIHVLVVLAGHPQVRS
ncbi:hypothetical protein OCU04_013079 [Sclerotinia nivalis]|uniref:Uncharacterized protein n=1 Tax=Sclerotinia nivalis TaxID=352851 RepID=A0A9X0A8C3_9HELO|nr:hypothetical protein OCU04_013079 [Sclerotinia nivalis]